MFKQMLCMMAVHRNYAFYNRVICMWYIDNLYQEMHTYEISGPAAVGGAMKGGLPVLNLIKALVFGGQWSDTVSNWLSAKQRMATVCGFGSLEEMFAIDQFTTRVPVYFEGWNEEKQAECRELMALDDETLLATLAARQRDSLLDSPAPMYKQGAAEWAGERFGGGTMASDACCPTAIATVLSGLLEQRITPLEIANKYDTDLYRDPSSGSYGGRMCEAAGNDFGIAHEAGRGELSSAEIREALATGAMIVMSMQPSAPGGAYATVYHYVALVGLTGAGQVIVNNPGINGDVTYDDMSTILNNQSGRGYGIFFPTQGAYLAYEAQMHPAAQETEAE